MKSYYYLDYLHREIFLEEEDIQTVPESGRADDACSAIAEKPYVVEQFMADSFRTLKDVASRLCDSPDIKSRHDALMYIVWRVALDIKEWRTLSHSEAAVKVTREDGFVWLLVSAENAHRVTMVRRVDAPESEPVAFLFRGKRHGYCSYSHLVGNPGKEEILAPADFKDWEVVEVAHPGYLEEYFKQACSSYNLTSFSPDERGESDIASHEKELHEDLQSMPEQQRERYMENYKRYFSAMIAANSRCASAMITGPARFNTGRNEKACNSHAKSVTAFREWRERALEAIRKATEAAKPEEQRLEEEWQKVKAFIDDAASTIHGIDTGTARGYSRALFVSNLAGRLSTYVNHGNVEIIDRAVARLREWNDKVKKPVVTARHSIFKYPELVRKVREKQQERASRENREIPFDGGKVVYNFEEDRLQILFDKIPDTDMRTTLKRNAFKWAPRNQAWQRQLTRNAEYAAGQVLKITI